MTTRRWVVFVCLSAFVLSLTGCEPLKKKFTRKKKEDKSNEIIPVLQPVEYPAKTHSAKENYEQHYSLWKVWYQDTLASIDRRDSEKKQKYALTQAIAQLTEMKNWIVEEKQKKLSLIIEEFNKILQEWDKLGNLRNTFFIKKGLERNGKTIRLNFSPKVLKDYFTP